MVWKKGGEDVHQKYESVQKEIDKILCETRSLRTHNKHRHTINDKKYESEMKRIGKLLLELNNLEEKNRKNWRHKREAYPEKLLLEFPLPAMIISFINLFLWFTSL